MVQIHGISATTSTLLTPVDVVACTFVIATAPIIAALVFYSYSIAIDGGSEMCHLSFEVGGNFCRFEDPLTRKTVPEGSVQLERFDALVLDMRKKLCQQLEDRHHNGVDKCTLHPRQILKVSVHEWTAGQIEFLLCIALQKKLRLNRKGPLPSHRAWSGRVGHIGNVEEHTA